MAGLGERCSHVGAVLFYIEFAVNLRGSETCTKEKAYWLLPGYKKVEHTNLLLILTSLLQLLFTRT